MANAKLILLCAVTISACAMTRAHVTDMGAGRYMVTSHGNAYASHADAEQRAVEEAVAVCRSSGLRPVFDSGKAGTSETFVFNTYAQRPNVVLYFHCGRSTP